LRISDNLKFKGVHPFIDREVLAHSLTPLRSLRRCSFTTHAAKPTPPQHIIAMNAEMAIIGSELSP
jgi:hypothetical protein